MTYENVCRVTEALKALGGKPTASEVAAHLGIRQAHASAMLGKLGMYGIINRTRVLRPDNHGCMYRYSVKTREQLAADLETEAA